MESIQSKDNSFIKDIKKLKDKKYRTENNKFLIEGFRFVSEALQSNFNVSFIFISDKALDKYDNFHIKNKLQKNTQVYKVTEQILKGISSTDTPQGIVAVVDNKNIKIENKQGFYVLVDKVQDPGNMGTIIRTAHAAGSLGIIVTKGTVDIYNEKTLRSTMGSIFHIPIIQDDNLEKLEVLKTNGFKLVVSSLDTENNFFDVNLKDRVIIAVGNEGNGVSEEIFHRADYKIKIPMPGDAESLNVSIAAAVMMFEVVRQSTL
ncbi:RNA methyltransferase [Clostridium sp. DJ247]|uniref:TrmH family RNA methyltransferase n=1 Tax=Clostridium sp. DJ247 TaxID=2726188 RepID=UPI001629C986|nr:RNA methyltransferase [Clostridium sp. DJ247]MBC2580282.1 RNA methyltransferase [Clostridium sp. DJ247]